MIQISWELMKILLITFVRQFYKKHLKSKKEVNLLDSQDVFNALWSLKVVELKKVPLKFWAKCYRHSHFHILKVSKKDQLFMFYSQTSVDLKSKFQMIIFHMEKKKQLKMILKIKMKRLKTIKLQKLLSKIWSNSFRLIWLLNFKLINWLKILRKQRK